MNLKFKKGEKAYMQMPVEVKSIDKDLGTLEAIFSTQDVDRHGDVVLQEGWDLTNFKKNPVILNSHNYGDAAEVIGKASNVKVESRKLLGKITFAVAENPKAKVIFDLYAGGFLNAFSVGFIPTKFKQNKDGSTDWFTIEEAELLEVSAVSVPANARALAKAKGIDLEVLNDEEDDNEQQDTEGNTDEVPKGDEIPPADGEEPAGDGDGSESGSEGGDEDAGSDAGSGESNNVIPEEDNAGSGTHVLGFSPLAPETISYKKKVAGAIQRIDSREKQHLRKVAEIVSSLIAGDVGTKVDRNVREQMRKRKVNQAIRSLMKVR